MTTIPGRPVKLDEVKAGMKLIAGSEFTCLRPGTVLEVFCDRSNPALHVCCMNGRHYLNPEGALGEWPSECTHQDVDSDGTLVGLYQYEDEL